MSYNSNPKNQPDGYTFDDSGDLLSSPNAALGNSIVNIYDAENRLVTPNSGATRYEYNAEGRRVAKITGGSEKIYIYDAAGRVINEMSSTLR